MADLTFNNGPEDETSGIAMGADAPTLTIDTGGTIYIGAGYQSGGPAAMPRSGANVQVFPPLVAAHGMTISGDINFQGEDWDTGYPQSSRSITMDDDIPLIVRNTSHDLRIETGGNVVISRPGEDGYRLPNTVGTEGQTLVLDQNGNLSWVDPAGTDATTAMLYSMVF